MQLPGISADATSITFAVVGHNEARTLPRALGMAQEASRAGDGVVFVDSASTDDSAVVAAACATQRLAAPLGKGNAIQYAVERAQTGYVCVIDADIEHAAQNIPLVIGECVRETGAAMVIADFEHEGEVLSNTIAVYEPVVAALFPEARDKFGSRPLSGFRAFRAARAQLPFPPGFGLEAHLNVTTILAGHSPTVVAVGEIRRTLSL